MARRLRRRAARAPEELTTAQEDVGELLGRMTASAEDGVPGSSKDRFAVVWAEVAAALVRSAVRAGAAAVTSGRWLAEQLVAAAPHLPVRDLPTLRAHYRGLEGEALADALVKNAIRATSAVGVAGGALSAVKWFAPLTLLTVPIQLAVETLAVAAIEVKLVGELHEVYGIPVRGTPTQRGIAYSTAWADRRGVTSMDPKSLPSGLGLVARQRLQRRLLIRVGRETGTITPLFIGAAYGGWANHRTTQRLADELRADLRRGRPLTGSLMAKVVHGALSSGAQSSGAQSSGAQSSGTQSSGTQSAR